MRRSLGGGGRRAMGGGGGGGGMVKTFQRTVRAGVGGARPSTTANIGDAKAGKAKNFSNKPPTSPNTALALSSSSSSTPFPSLINLPISAASAPSWVSSSSTVCSEESEWEYIDVIDGETAARGFYEDYLFGTVPSSGEVHHAVSALQQALGSSPYMSSADKAKIAEVTNKDLAVEAVNPIISLSGSEMNWVEPSQMLQDPRSDIVYDAFHLLETEPCVQRMVVSLSSDKAVWDAVLNNEAVKELRGSIHQAASVVGKSSNEGSDGDENILSWIVMFAKAKIVQLLDKITELVNNVFVKKGNSLDEKVRSSFFLSIVVVIIVVLARTKTKNA